jgi:hypothetical protein
MQSAQNPLFAAPESAAGLQTTNACHRAPQSFLNALPTHPVLSRADDGQPQNLQDIALSSMALTTSSTSMEVTAAATHAQNPISAPRHVAVPTHPDPTGAARAHAPISPVIPLFPRALTTSPMPMDVTAAASIVNTPFPDPRCLNVVPPASRPSERHVLSSGSAAIPLQPRTRAFTTTPIPMHATAIAIVVAPASDLPWIRLAPPDVGPPPSVHVVLSEKLDAA